MTSFTKDSTTDWRSALVITVSALLTVAAGIMFPLGGGLAVGLLAGFTILRNVGAARWRVIALGGFLTLLSAYLYAGK